MSFLLQFTETDDYSELKILMKIQLSVICAHTVDFHRPSHKIDYSSYVCIVCYVELVHLRILLHTVYIQIFKGCNFHFFCG